MAGARSITRWALPSPEPTDSCTAKNAGDEMKGGVSLPPGPITKVAGTRASVEPPPEGLAVFCVDPRAEPEAPFVRGLLVLPVAPEDAVELVAVTVWTGRDELVVAGEEAELALFVADLVELPHAPISRKTGSSVTET